MPPHRAILAVPLPTRKRYSLTMFDRDIIRLITPPFNWNDVTGQRVWRIRWAGSAHLYSALATAQLAYEWLCVTGQQPEPITALTGFPWTAPRGPLTAIPVHDRPSDTMRLGPPEKGRANMGSLKSFLKKLGMGSRCA